MTVVEKYRGVDILRDSPSVKMLSDDAALTYALARLHAFPKGIKASALAIEAIREEIDKVLDAPPDPPAGPIDL